MGSFSGNNIFCESTVHYIATVTVVGTQGGTKDISKATATSRLLLPPTC